MAAPELAPFPQWATEDMITDVLQDVVPTPETVRQQLLNPERDLRQAVRLATALATRCYLYRDNALLSGSKFLNNGATQAHVAWLAGVKTAIVGFPGSYSATDWVVTNPDAWLVPVTGDVPKNGSTPRVHEGYLHAFQDIVSSPGTQRVHDQLANHLGNDGNGTNLICVGHSLGGALTTMTAEWAARTWPKAKVFCYTIGSPRVGNAAFRDSFDKGVAVSYRVVNGTDPVPAVPPAEWDYRHVKGAIWLKESWLFVGSDLIQAVLDLVDTALAIFRLDFLRRTINLARVTAVPQLRQGDFFINHDATDHLFTNYFRRVGSAAWHGIRKGGPAEPDDLHENPRPASLRKKSTADKNSVLVAELKTALWAQARDVTRAKAAP